MRADRPPDRRLDPCLPSVYAGLRNPVGTHVQVGKGLVKGGAGAGRRGRAPRPSRCSSATPAAGRTRPATRSVDRAFRDACETSGIGSSSTRPTWSTWARRPRRRTSDRWPRWPTTSSGPLEIGAEGVVVHTGSCVDEGTRGRGDAAGPRGTAPGARRGRRRRALAAAGADRRSGPVAVRRRRGPRALPRRALDRHPGPGSAWTPATCSRPAPRSTSRAAPPRPSTGSSRSADRGGCGWSTRTTRWTSAARSRTGTRASATATSDSAPFEELFAHPATDGRAVHPRDARLPRRRRPATSRCCKKLRDAVSGPDRRTTLLATLGAARR